MVQYIDKDTVITKLERRIESCAKQREDMLNVQCHTLADDASARMDELNCIKDFLDTVEVKEAGDNSLEKFKSLQHINKDIQKTMQDWGYAPNLYFFDGSWHVDWISCEEGDSIKDFTADTAEEAIDKACNWLHSTFCNG